jgi:HEPN domain-containing protein
MAVPSSKEARLFYRCAFQRYEDAQILFRDQRTTGAVYLAGYSIECILKALILSVVPARNQAALLQSFRGNQAHDYEWLRYQYRLNGGARFPREINRDFTLVNDWSTDLRYTPRTLKEDEAEAFLAAAEAIVHWADGRL